MNAQTKLYAAIGVAAALLILGLLVSFAWSHRRVRQLEQAVQTAMRTAGQIEQTALKKELEAAAYKQKIDYLDGQLSQIRDLANKQDEDLKNLTTNTRSARADVERARRTRAAAATASELCQKLAQVGHPCD